MLAGYFPRLFDATGEWGACMVVHPCSFLSVVVKDSNAGFPAATELINRRL